MAHGTDAGRTPAEPAATAAARAAERLPGPQQRQRRAARDRSGDGAAALQEFRAQLNGSRFRDGVASIVPAEFRSVGYVDRLCESIFVACRDNPDLLLKCDRASFPSRRTHRQEGPDGRRQHGVAMPYNG